MSELNYFAGDELAADVWRTKYAQEEEETPDDMHWRMAKRIAETIGKSVYEIFENFRYFKYIIPQGSVMASLGTDKIASLSNCFVVGQPDDSYAGIMRKDEELAQLMKRRGGVGIDISTLRPSGTKVNNAAQTSTGAASFMHRFSNTTREVAQDGRRGALMITMDVRHPDILEFVQMKQDLSKVTGANVSVMLRDDFMKAVEEDRDYYLRFPCNQELGEFKSSMNHNILYETNNSKVQIKRIKAKELWDQIIHCAWSSAEPGLIFIDRHWNYSPDSVYEQYKGVTTNPLK